MKWEVRQGDALDLLRGMPAGSIDAVVTDPPYCSGGFTETQRRGSKGQGVQSHRVEVVGYFEGDNMGTAGLVWMLRSMAFAAADRLVESGSLLVFCDWRQVANIGPAIESSGLRWSDLVVWDKGSAALGQGFRAQHELCLHYTRGGYGNWAGEGKSEGNVLRVKRVTPTHRHHFAGKPLDLLRRMIRVVTPPGGLVVDPFCGSGATGCAALIEGRRFIGFERSEKYVEVARARLAMAEADPLSSCRLSEADQIGLFGEGGAA